MQDAFERFATVVADLDRSALAETVLRDVLGGEAESTGAVELEAERAAAAAAVDWILASLAAGAVPEVAALARLRAEAAAAARSGIPLKRVLDRALSAGWVVWAAATRLALPAEVLAALGDALLRTGDAAAAALSDGHESAERELARRSGAALRELLDGLLELDGADLEGRARLGRRLADLGIASDRRVSVALVATEVELSDDAPEVTEVARRLIRGPIVAVGDLRTLGGPSRAPVIAAVGGRLVVILPPDRPLPDLGPALAALGERWCGVLVHAASLLEIGVAARQAAATLAIARRVDRAGLLLPDDLALERALLAEPALLRAAVARELGPLTSAPRGSGLVETLEAYLGARENVQATARRLGVAPRTVAYRLERIERLLAAPLDAERRLRLATALFARRILGA